MLLALVMSMAYGT